MRKLLVRLFIKNYQDTSDATVRAQYGKLAGMVGIVSNILLCILKIITGFLTGSISITADGINNLSDAGSSIITLIGFKLSSAPPDKDHPFGHQRIEYITGLVVSIIIVIIGILLGKSSIEKIINPTEFETNLIVFIILGISILFKLWQGFFYKMVGKEIDSTALLATSTDSINDVLSTSAVCLSMIIYYFTSFIYIDGIIGTFVSIFVIISGVKMLKETASPLIGDMPHVEVVDAIVNLMKEYDGVLGYHDLVIHNYGPNRIFATIHCEVDRTVDIMLSHDMIDNIERETRDKLKIELVIHMDPVDIDNPETIKLREMVHKLLLEFDPQLSFHDFRVVHGVTHTNVLFDVVKPIKYRLSSNELKDTIVKLITTENNFLVPVVEIDETYAIENKKE